MPPTEVAEPEAPEILIEGTPEQEEEFGTKIADVFSKLMPTEEELEAAAPEKVEPEPAKSEEPKKVEPKKEEPAKVKDSKLPESVFEDAPVKVEPVKEEDAPKKIETPPELKGKARENFQKLADSKFEVEKQLRDERRAREKAETKLTEGDPNAKARIEELERTLKAQSELVERVSLESHPEFQARYEIPRKQLLETAKTAYTDAGGNPADMEMALSLTGKARIEKLEELLAGVPSELLKRKIERANDNLEGLETERGQVLANRSVHLKQLQEQEQANKHKFLQEHEKVTKENLGKAEELLRDTHKFEVFKATDDPNFKWWNDQRAKINEASETLMLRTSDPAELAVASKLAAACPVYRTMFLEERKERLALQKRLSEFEGSEPGVGGGDKKGAAQIEAEDDENLSVAEAIVKSVRASKQ